MTNYGSLADSDGGRYTSGESLLYNRDTNFSGTSLISIEAVIPSYGARVSFSANNHSYETDNKYYNLMPMSANSLTAKFDVKYDVEESLARSLSYFFEAHSGVKQFKFRTDTEVYKEVSGVCINYAINHMNNQHYEVAASVEVLEAPNLLNWSGMNFVSGASSLWRANTAYEKYDVVLTGDHSSNKLNCFFYCTGDHTSSVEGTTIAESNAPSGIKKFWSQKFFFEPDQGFQNDVRMDVQEINFKNSHKLRIKNKDNISSFPINYKFSSITTKQLKCMLHFLENKGGYRRFEHQIPSVYNRPKVYYCPEWSHTFKYYNSHDLDVSFIEDPLGVIPTGT
jgi:phage-related protein